MLISFFFSLVVHPAGRLKIWIDRVLVVEGRSSGTLLGIMVFARCSWYMEGAHISASLVEVAFLVLNDTWFM